MKLYLKKFKDEERIFIPERVAREFIKNRDGKLADLVKALNDKKSRISPPELELSKLFQHMEQFSELGEISKNVNELIKKYKSSYSKMVDDIKSCLEIKDDNRGDEHDYVSFAYTAYEEGILGLIP